MGDWGKSLGGGLAESTSLSAFTLTINSVRKNLRGDWGKGLGEGLAKSTSFTAFTLTINGGPRFQLKNWIRDQYLRGDWGKGPG